MSLVRVPTQKRSIEKKERIIQKGFELMCENGYFNTNTNDIAKYADVSTGIIYQYFNDKKDIFIEGVKNYSDNIMFPILDILDTHKFKMDNLENLLNKLLDIFIKKHTLSKKAHEEIISLAYLDDEIADIIHDKEMITTKKIVDILESNGIRSENLTEKVHIVIGLVENYCHEIVYHKHESLRYDVMKQEVIKVICGLLNN